MEGDKSQWVCMLNQALFGLRDSAYPWNEEMDCELGQIGFHPLEDDPCNYPISFACVTMLEHGYVLLLAKCGLGSLYTFCSRFSS